MFLESKTPTEHFEKFKSFRHIQERSPRKKSRRKWLAIFLIATGVVLCLPWTQTIQSSGSVSTLNPQQRPQQINSLIAGRIGKWNIKDGDIVSQGDTLLVITEIKEEYLDPAQLSRMDEQIRAKEASIGFYKGKATSTAAQSSALDQGLRLKLSQLRNKLRQYKMLTTADSMSYVAAESQLAIAREQLQRQKELYSAGLKSLTELEQRQQAYQDAQAKAASAQNKFYYSRNELINIQLEQSSAEQEYAEKISKTTGERFSALSEMSASQSEVAKLRNQLSNYRLRRDFYVIVAPQSGQVIQTTKAGIGETVKEGDPLLEIVPVNFQAAVEIFVNPLDLPLVRKGQKVQLQFDGFPAIVFSGWPNSSYGTFSGRVAAVNPSISSNGKFSAWIVPDEAEKGWPQQLRYGAGAKGLALLNDVPIVYELWRKLNGFPPKYYADLNGKDAAQMKKNEN